MKTKKRPFRIGDVVELTYGGPQMSIVSIESDHGPLCRWHSADLHPCEENYPPEALILIDPCGGK